MKFLYKLFYLFTYPINFIKLIIKKNSLTLFLVLVLGMNGVKAQIYVNTFTGASACPTNGNTPTMATNSTGSAVSRATITCNSTANVFNSTTLNNTSSISNASYIQFSATANSGFILNLTSVSFLRQGSNSAPNQMEVRYSTDGFSTSTTWGSAPVTPTSGTIATWDFADFSTGNGGTVTFRIYPYGTTKCDLTAGAASNTGAFRVDNVTINGTVSAANNLCTNATSLACGASNVNGSTVNSTSTTPPGSASTSNFGVWYTFTGNNQATTISSTAAAGFDHEIAVLSGSACSGFSLLASRDLGAAGGTESVSIPTTNGTTYYVWVAHWSSTGTSTDAGTFTISRSCVNAPANNLCTNATSLTVGAAAVAGTLTNATFETPITTYNDVWYSFTAPCNGTYTVNLTGLSSDEELGIYGSCGTASSIALGTTSSTTSETVNFTATGSTVYYIRVYDFDNNGGGFNITVTGPSCVSVPVLSSPIATSIATTSATLGATVTSNGGAVLTARGTVWGTTASPTGNVLAEGGTTVAAFTHSRTGLTANTAYTYRGYATNSAGTGYSADGTFTTLHNAPTVGSGSGASTSAITANWSAPSGGSAAFTYEVQLSTSSTDFTSPVASQTGIASGTNNFQFTGLNESTTYYYRVRANNAGGSSAWSGTSSGITTAGAITFNNTDNWIASGSITSYSNHSYSQSNWLFEGNLVLREVSTSPVQDGVAVTLGTYAWRLQDAAGSSLTATFNSSATISAFSFDVRRWDNSPDPIYTVEFSTNSGGSWTNTGTTINNAYLGSSNWKNFSYTLASAANVTSGQFKVRIVRSSGERIMIDNFSWTGTSEVRLTTMGTAATEDFNTLVASETSSVILNGWYISESGSAANTSSEGGTGSNSAGNTYSFGTSRTDRALGGLQSGTLVPTIGAKFVNNTGSTINNLSISYTGETWRVGATGRADRLDFQYSLNATSLTTGTWTDVNTLDYENISQGSTSSGSMIHSSSISNSITGLSIANGSTFWIRWNDLDATGADDGMGVDDFTIRPCVNNSISGQPSTAAANTCLNGSAFSALTVTATGTSLTYQWQQSADGSTNWVTAVGGSGATTGSYTPPNNLAGILYYRCLITNGCGVVSTSGVSGAITVNPTSVGGTASSNQTICSGSSPANITLAGNTGTIQWQWATNLAFTTPNNITGATASPLTSAQMGSLTATRYYRAVVTSGVCAAANSTTVTVTVDPASVGGTASSNQIICSGSSPANITLAGNTGTIQWQWATDLAFTTPNNITGATASPLTSAQMGTLTATRYYRAVVTSGVCAAANSTTVTVTVNPASVGGTITGSINYCSNTNSTTLTLTNYTGSIIKWQSTTDGGLNWSDISNTNSTLTVTNLSINTDYRVVVTSGVCNSVNSNTGSITVTILTAPTILNIVNPN